MAEEQTDNAEAAASPAGDGEAANGPTTGEGGEESGGLVETFVERVLGEGRGDDANGAAASWLEAITPSATLQVLIMLGVVVLAALLAHVIARTYLLWLVRSIAGRVFRVWDHHLIERRVFQRLVPIVAALVVHATVRFVPHVPEELIVLVQRLALATVVLSVASSLGAMYSAINDIYVRFPVSAGRPIKGYLQIAKVITYVATAILVLAVLMGQPLGYFLSGLGAMTAIIMLLFRETLLSFVAGVQLVNNDLVRVGDWISMPQFDADGDVVDIALNVVKVRNWDRTVTMIPTHKFLEHSFKNWRTMFEGGGRRIQRSLNIDMTTIRFLTEEEIRRFSRFVLLEDYVREKVRELQSHNEQYCPEDRADIIANARHLTNVGTFRAYVTEYLRRNPNIHDELTFLVRQLAPTPQGLPIEIYVFSRETAWGRYEGIQGDIFDHLLAIAQEFGLRVFQEPSGYDLASLGGRRRARRSAGSESGAYAGSNGD